MTWRRFLSGTWPFLALAGAVLGVLWPLGLTTRVLAGIDAYTYFTPYWAHRAAALRAGQIPLWNPYLFLGVPFLANPQAAVLYPLNWPLAWLSAAQALVWSALLHAWLAAAGTYIFGRRSLGLTKAAALLAGLLFGLGGYTVARVENINQLNALAWFPAMLWLYDECVRSLDARHALRWGIALAIAVALALLAGHTQTAFLDLAGLALYAAAQGLQAALGKPLPHPLPASGKGARPPFSSREGGQGVRYLLPLLALLPAVLLAAAQLWPSIELSGLGLRTGGLSFRQAVSFSLRPRLLLQSLLPPLGGGLAEAFGSEGYAEYLGYMGIGALVLAVLGIWSIYRPGRPQVDAVPSDTRGLGPARGPGSLAEEIRRSRRALPWLGLAGLLLALGGYDPLYYLLWRVVPGFALFRAPARWLALYALAAAALAGVGLDALAPAAPKQTRASEPVGSQHREQETRSSLAASRRPIARVALLIGGLGLLAALALQQWPRWPVVAGWVVAGLAAIGLWWLARRRPALGPAIRVALMALALGELWLGGRALPFAAATSPVIATGMRNAPAALLAATASDPPAGRPRFLSLSDIRFDPGDLADLRKVEAGMLGADATDRLVRAAKQLEVVAPNLSLLLRLPAVDGYDGGTLPLARYVRLQSLFLPPDQLSPDGRLREQLREVPPDRLLDLTGTRYVITDKQNDLWAGDVYYDVEQAVPLEPGQALRLDLAGYPPFSATALGVVSYLKRDDPGAPAAALSLVDAAGRRVKLDLVTGQDTAVAAEAAPPGVQVARNWPDWMGVGRDYLAVKDFCGPTAPAPLPAQEGENAPPRVGEGLGERCPFTPTAIEITAQPGSSLVLRGLSLIDQRTGAHQSITLSPRGDRRRVYSGDVKIYDRLGAPGRAWLVYQASAVPDDEGALARLSDPAFDPRRMAVLTAPAAVPSLGPAPKAPGSTQTEVYEAERAVLRTDSAAPALLVVADAAYPGWTATVDGNAAPILTTNLMFRGVAVPAGQHMVELRYASAAWRRGLVIALGTLVLLLVVLLVTTIGTQSVV